jgi:hypothetical protein
MCFGKDFLSWYILMIHSYFIMIYFISWENDEKEKPEKLFKINFALKIYKNSQKIIFISHKLWFECLHSKFSRKDNSNLNCFFRNKKPNLFYVFMEILTCMQMWKYELPKPFSQNCFFFKFGWNDPSNQNVRF